MFLLWLSVGLLTATIYGSFFEWTFHKYMLHRPMFSIRYPFKHHALIHHYIFKANDTYHLLNEKDKNTIPMAWWSGPLIVLIAILPFALISFLTGLWGILLGATITTILYFITYEYIHWCMHLPKKRSIERNGLFFRLNGHHLLHHRYMNKNFNVVLPLADMCLGTLLKRSKIKFEQAIGPSIPNLQPLS